MKICIRCKKKKEDWEFSIDNKTSSRLNSWCRHCICERAWESKLWHEYGITFAHYEIMLKSQNGVCAICGQFETVRKYGKIQRLCVDHNHKTMKVRGLLCSHCNSKLGLLENKNWMSKAQVYLEKHK